jgi:hypothetical protein
VWGLDAAQKDTKVRVVCVIFPLLIGKSTVRAARSLNNFEVRTPIILVAHHMLTPNAPSFFSIAQLALLQQNLLPKECKPILGDVEDLLDG